MGKSIGEKGIKHQPGDADMRAGAGQKKHKKVFCNKQGSCGVCVYNVF